MFVFRLHVVANEQAACHPTERFPESVGQISIKPFESHRYRKCVFSAFGCCQTMVVKADDTEMKESKPLTSILF